MIFFRFLHNSNVPAEITASSGLLLKSILVIASLFTNAYPPICRIPEAKVMLPVNAQLLKALLPISFKAVN